MLCFGNGSWSVIVSELCTEKVIACLGQNLAGDRSTNVKIQTSKFWYLGPDTISFTGRGVSGVSERSLLFLLALVHLSDIQNQEKLMSLTWFVNLHLLVLGDLQCTCYSRCLMIGMIFGIFATKAILLPKKTPNTHTKKASKQASKNHKLIHYSDLRYTKWMIIRHVTGIS